MWFLYLQNCMYFFFFFNRLQNFWSEKCCVLLNRSSREMVFASIGVLRTDSSFLNWKSNAGFRLTCCSLLCRYTAWSSLAVSELQLSAATPLWLFIERQSLPSWIEFNCLRSAARWAKRQGYRSIGMTLLAAWSSLCDKWRLRSWTNIIIKAAMRQAAS